MSKREVLAVDTHKLVASICKESFYDFLKEFWSTVIPETPVYAPHIKVVCDEIQLVAERVLAGKKKEYDLVVNIPPGSTKSTIISMMFPAWLWTRMPTCRVIGCAYAAQIAIDLSTKNRDIVKSELYQKCFPDVRIRADVDAKGHFMTTLGGERYAFGIGGAVTGKHAHVLIVDDPLNPTEAASEQELKAVNRWMQETLPTRKIDKEIAPTILVMQRLHQDDPSARMLLKSDVKHICLPGELTDGVKPPELRAIYSTDGLLDSKRMSRSVLESMRVDLGAYGYAGQILQDPIAMGAGMFKTNMLRIEMIPPGVTLTKVVRYWDKAGTSGGGCLTAGVKMGVSYNAQKLPTYWILHAVWGQWGPDEREAEILKWAQIDGKSVRVMLEQEPGSSGIDSVNATIKNLAGFRCEPDKVTGEKVVRAEPLAGQINIGNVVLVPGEWNREFIDELKWYPNSKFKDRTDAASGAFNHLSKQRLVAGAL